MAKIYTPEELGLRSQKASYTPEELGLTPPAPKEKPQSTGLSAALKSGTYNLNANIWEGVGRTGDYVYKSLGKEPRYEKGLTSIAKWVKDSRKASEAIGYKPEYKVADVIKDPTKAVPYVLEKLAESAPEMAMFASPVAWGPVAIGKANDNLDTILKNDGRTLKDVTFGDVSKAISIAGAQTALGATQVNRLMGLGSAKAVPGTTKLQRVSTEAQANMLFEAGDEILGYVGTHAGTKKGIKPDELLEVILGSALVGGSLGGVSKGVAEVASPQFKKPEETLSPEPLPEPTQEETVEPSEPPVSQQAQPIEAQVQQLMDNFGLSEPEARDVIANETQQTQAAPEPITPEVLPQEPASELDTALSNPAVQAGLQEANASIEALGPMSGPDIESAIKRASVQNALVESGTSINEARKLVDILEANNYEISRSGTNVGRVEPSVPMPDEGTVSAGEPDGFGRIDLGRNIEPTPVPPGGDVTQYNPLGETNVQTPIQPQAPFGIEPAQNFAPLEPSVQQGPESIPPTIEPVEEVPPLAQPQEAQFQPQQEPILPNIEAAQASEAPIDLGRNIEPTESVPLQAAPQEGAFDLGANIEPKEVSSIENPLVQKPKAKKPRKSIEQLKREKAAFQADQKDRNQRLKALNKIRSFLNKTLDVDAFPSPETAFFAGKSLLAHKKGFLDLVQNIANTPKYKGTEVGRRANKILSNLSDKERADVKARAKDFLKDKDAVKLAIKFPKSVRNNPNPAYNNFKTATQAANWVAKHGTDFEKDLVKKLLPHLRGVNLNVVDNVADYYKTKVDLNGGKAIGLYKESSKGRDIYIDSEQGINNATFLHESLHAATMARLNKYDKAVKEKQPVDKQVQEAVRQLNILLKEARDKVDGFSPADFIDYGLTKSDFDNMLLDAHEFVSYGMTDVKFQSFLMENAGGTKEGAVTRFFYRLADILRKMFGFSPKHNNAFQDIIDITDTMLAMEPETEVSVPSLAMMRKVSDDIDKDISKLDAAQSSSEVAKSIFNMAKQGHNFSDYVEALETRFDAFSEKSLKPLLYTLQTDDIVRWKGDEIAPIARINDLSRKVSGMRTRLHGKANELAEEFTRFVRNNGNKTISDAMHIARLQEISFAKNPTLTDALSNDWIVKEQEAIINDPKATQSVIDKATLELQKRKDNLTKAYKIWGDLGRQKGGQDMYRKIQGYYASYMRSRRYYLDKRLEGMDMEKSAKKNLIASIRTMYETAAKNSGDYFPLMRHGDYWLRVKKGPNEAKGFYKFDSPEDRNAFLDKVAKQHGLDKDDSDIFSVGVHEDQVFDAMRQNSKMLREMFSAIDKADSKNKEALKDEIFQVYLHTMPEASMRRQFIHPDKVTGFSGDVLRNFKSYSMKAGNELARLAYNDQIENEIASGYAALEGAPTLEQGKLKLFVDEMASRAREELNPLPENNVVSKINQFTFLWLLTSASSAAIQMVSVPVMVLPTLMARFGTAPASAKFAKYSNFLQALSGKVNTYEDGTKTIVWPTIKESKIARDNPMLLKAINEATDDYNLFQSTNVSVLTDRNKTPEKVSDNVAAQAARKTYNIMTAMFNGSERISRELTFGMTFELEYAKTKNYDKAKEAAIKAVDELLGRYDNANRPRVFRNALMKNIGQFKQYSIVMTSFWMRNMYNALKGEDAATRMFAIERMVGTSLMGAMFHGILGSPFYHATALTLDAILNADEEDKKERIKKSPLTAESSDLRFRYEYLPDTFGHIKVPNASGRQIPLNTVLERGPISALTDMNFGTKTSHDITSLWFRDAKPGANWAESAQNMLIANLGPSVSTSVNFIGGMQDMYDGKVARGLEKLSPAFVKGFPMAYRLKTEGAETKTNKDILRKDEIDTINLIGSVTGLQPTRLTRLQDRNFRFQSEIIKANGEKSKLLNKLNSAIYDEDSPDKSAIKDVYKDIVKHNERYPMEGMYIDYETIERSTNSYADRKMKTYRGLQVNDAVLPYMAKILKMSQP